MPTHAKKTCLDAVMLRPHNQRTKYLHRMEISFFAVAAWHKLYTVVFS